MEEYPKSLEEFERQFATIFCDQNGDRRGGSFSLIMQRPHKLKLLFRMPEAPQKSTVDYWGLNGTLFYLLLHG
jgi:hypothetical protein